MSTDLEKFSSQMAADVLEELRTYARTSGRNISDLLTEAVAEHLARVQLRPAFRSAADEVLKEHEELLSRLAK